MKVSAILRKDRKDENGLSKIVIRINDRSSQKYVTTRYKVKPSQFQNGRVVKHEDASVINKDLQQQIQEIEESGKRPTVVTFETYCTAFISHHQKAGTRKPDMIRQYKGELSKFLRFSHDIPLQKITPDLLKSYHVYMKGKLGNAHNTIWKSFKFLKTIFNQAIKEGIVKSSPFAQMDKLTYKQTARTFLTAAEIKKIGALKIEPSNPLYNIQKWFLIQCYTGLRAGDLEQVDTKRIFSEGRIIIHTNKTGEVVSQPLLPNVKELLEQAPPFKITNQEYNRQLKSLAALAGVSKNISSHIARHSFAMRLMELGKDIHVAQKLLGHSSINTTKIYAKIQDKRIDEAFSDFGY